MPKIRLSRLPYALSLLSLSVSLGSIAFILKRGATASQPPQTDMAEQQLENGASGPLNPISTGVPASVDTRRELNKDVFSRREDENFPAIYLTLVSIIQGVALGFLMQNSIGTIAIREPLNLRTFVLYAGASFLTLIVVSSGYTWFVSVYRWSITAVDITLIFLVAVAEYTPLFFFDKPRAWWGTSAALGFVGTIAHVNTLLHCKFKDPGVQRLARRSLGIDIALTLILAVSSVWYCVSYVSWSQFEAGALVISYIGLVSILVADWWFVRRLRGILT